MGDKDREISSNEMIQWKPFVSFFFSLLNLAEENLKEIWKICSTSKVSLPLRDTNSLKIILRLKKILKYYKNH